jgi:hypothetical protein
MSRIYVIHENDAWVEPLRTAFAELGLPYAEWFTAEGRLDLASVPPQGVFYNRMSASSHTRGHRFAAELTGGLLAWLAAVGREAIVEAAKAMRGRFITKHNRAGKGLGVRLFDGVDALARYVDSAAFEDSVDGITLIQKYIEAPEPFITRVEFVGGKFLYAVRVDTSQGFELCPADVCQVDDAFCPVGESAPAAAGPRFRIVNGFAHPIVERYRRFLADNGIGIAGIEFITDRNGELYTYDVNTNTNYNADAEREAGVFGMRAIASYLGEELRALDRHPAAKRAVA